MANPIRISIARNTNGNLEVNLGGLTIPAGQAFNFDIATTMTTPRAEPAIELAAVPPGLLPSIPEEPDPALPAPQEH